MVLARLRNIRHEPFDGGTAWGEAGPYEFVSGVAHFAVDPSAEANRRITDLDRAERDGEGAVTFRSDFRILRPSQAGGPTNLLLVVPNRGRVGNLPFSLGTPWWDPTQLNIEAGDGFLLRQGWTVAWCGWQWDVVSGPSSLGLDAPEALEGGRPIEGDVRVDFTSEVRIADHALGDSGPMFSFRSYPAADVEQADAVLTVRDTVDGERRVIPRDRWAFARDEGGTAVVDDERIRLEGRFEPFRYYEVTYRTRRSPVVGAGLLAVRDFVSFLRYGGPGGASDGGPDDAGPGDGGGHGDGGGAGRPLAGGISAAFAYGASQSGRFLRHFLHEGLNLDEAGRKAFDGVLPHIAGARLGEFNQRYGQPSHYNQAGIGSLPPFSPALGLFERQTEAGGMPKVMLTNSAFEYYRGDAALVHVDPTGTRDLDLPAEVRSYLFAGNDHLGASPVKALMPVANPVNDLDATVALRAALTNLAAWATAGVEPPPSEVPRVSDGTAVAPEVAASAVDIPGARRPEAAGFARVRAADLGPDVERGVVRLPGVLGDAYPSLVPAPDADGNDISGIRLPEVAVPVATYTGWNARRHVEGLPDTLIDFAGSRFDFAPTPEAARAKGDPRPSIAERYRDRDDYAARLRSAVDALVAARHLLAGDAETAFEGAMARYDRAASSTVSSAAGSTSSRASGISAPLRTDRP